MRVLVTHHGQLPQSDHPVTGGALRANQHASVLRAAGHEVHLITRFQDSPSGFRSIADLRARVVALAPDRIVCVQPEDAPALSGLDIPTAVDLYAPRIVEAGFEGTLSHTTAMVFAALEAGDVFLTSNPRQQWSLRTLLTLAGFDPHQDPTRLIPLAAPQEVERQKAPSDPVFVAGGARWPWQDPVPALRRVLEHLDRRNIGRVIWYGGAPLIGRTDGCWSLPEHPRLTTPGWLPYPQLLAEYASATAAIDWQGDHPERRLALSFRHVDYLGAGIPVLTAPDSALVDVLGPAGIATDDIEAALDTVLDKPRTLSKLRKAARNLAEGHFHPDRCAAPLLEWVKSGARHAQGRGPLADRAALVRDAERAEARARQAEGARDRAEAEVAEKRSASHALTQQIHTLTDTVARQARALDEVAAFKREAIALLGNESARAQRSAEDLTRENGLLRADIEKKSAELRAMDELRARLENDLDNLRAELDRLRSAKGWLRRS
ncbi:MAG TPA: hypothetical protein DFR83_15530 [Deltaproteobacteria bacterium]|nr:hypothetical protein [Deltaproteobacteria bacterium]